ncbi:NAD(P)-dependent alcohol dehydrogenase [Dactylosporangium sp. CA-233914]|uniref:NAD(P)-dependent alcohol dehydrogenase n=1 Tax=Dactylosporangium sp. CA-233914 TaxID=3239934 RepID=UPI003D8FCE7D
MNAIDVTLRSGALRLVSGRRFPRRLGVDFAGEVDATGPGVTGWRRGDRVWGGVLGYERGQAGAAADYVLVPHAQLSPAPAGIDLITAAALPAVGVTALVALRHARLREGQRMLLRGAAGGFGSAAVQLAASLGAHVTAMASARHLDALRDLGAKEALDRRVIQPRDLPTYDVVVDAVGTDLAAYRRLAPRTVTIAYGRAGALAGIAASTVFGPRRIRSFRGRLRAADLALLTQRVEAGHLRPIVAGVYPLEEAARAHRQMEAGGNLGKLVIRPL